MMLFARIRCLRIARIRNVLAKMGFPHLAVSIDFARRRLPLFPTSTGQKGTTPVTAGRMRTAHDVSSGQLALEHALITPELGRQVASHRSSLFREQLHHRILRLSAGFGWADC